MKIKRTFTLFDVVIALTIICIISIVFVCIVF
jgi:type II secretory pathway component PulJ